jgi:hypothetical protein
MNIVGTVISVTTETIATKADKSGTYPAWQLIYKDASGQVKEVTKHVNGLKFTAGLKEGLESLSAGDTFTMVVEKEGKFNEVKGIEKGGNMPVVIGPTSSPQAGKVTGSNYETREERAARQRLIVRQSSLTAALGWYEVTKGKPSIEDVKMLADEFTNFVFETPQEEIK